MSKTIKLFTFSIIMSVVTGFLLTLTSVSLKDRQLENIAFDKQKKVLKALALMDFNGDFLKKDVLDLYASRVKNLFLTKSGDLIQERTEDSLPIFVVYHKGKSSIEKYAVHFEAYGLWSTMRGYMGLDGNGRDVIGFTVYEHGETPGLGAEVDKDWFANQFLGKKIVDANDKFVSIGVVKGKVKGKYGGVEALNYVDGISGSTITSKGLERDLKKELEKYEIFSANLRR